MAARSDKLFQKNQAKTSFGRPNESKNPKARVLIVCEGEKTEPNYFKALCYDLRLSNNDIKIRGEECGSSPKSVYEYTKELIEKDGDYDCAYCVFDKDQHGKSYTETLDAIKRNSSHKGTKIIAINSVPCFEFWFLLHFEPTSSPFNRCSDVEKRIKTHKKDYNKNKNPLTYKDLKSETSFAIKNAKQLTKNNNGENPSTRVHILVEALIKQAKENKKR